ncbi:hypothetical protein SPAB_05577 [Salmonella enterica subsp. enterica serovar Paratyphi B str. SPB7]|uniref:Uncharacterized protein n=1 Tax=Salmonella paratyphi B (strain ATCC BAA-1250 / SPB7) TaxID=1016998 RepID=A0A6C6ZAX0_SALPB|nr:hypothetical protein SPAB_05577 [Salmonella enterica subsp. enterica serovar Paratyphi B str. SPB7]
MLFLPILRFGDFIFNKNGNNVFIYCLNKITEMVFPGNAYDRFLLCFLF